jgi:hypothetical protein
VTVIIRDRIEGNKKVVATLSLAYDQYQSDLPNRLHAMQFSTTLTA